jgi:hypothetical protein
MHCVLERDPDDDTIVAMLFRRLWLCVARVAHFVLLPLALTYIYI